MSPKPANPVEPSESSAPPDTKERLLQAGMRVFAEEGFANAGLRRICEEADANVAAVNYHFGDKMRFYSEVLATCHLRTVTRNRMPTLDDDPERPRRVLEDLLRWFLEILLVESEAGYMGRLMAWEMVHPTEALDEVVRRSMLPMKLGLEQVLRAVGPPEMGDDELRLAFNSTLGQCLFYKHAQPVLRAMQRFDASQAVSDSGRQGAGRVFLPGPDDLDRLAAYIADFVVAGIHATAAPRAAPEGHGPAEDAR